MKVKYVLAMIIMIVYSNNSCELLGDHVYRFWILNNSNEALNFLVSYNYPDTIIPDTYDKVKSLNPNDKTPYDSKKKWEEVFYELPADTLSIFIFSRNTIINQEWEKILENYMVLKRYDLSIEDLEEQNWVVAYP
ncbi:MAG: hypothetical protein AB2L24_08580 [Mangrovibacterium sp.]